MNGGRLESAGMRVAKGSSEWAVAIHDLYGMKEHSLLGQLAVKGAWRGRDEAEENVWR